MVAAVLLVLRGMHTRVIGYGAYHAAVGTDIRGGIQRIGGNVKPDVLHGAERSCTAERCAECDFECHLFVGSPFGIHFIVFRDCFRDFGGRGSGVCRYDRNARFIQTSGNSGVAEQKLFYITVH